MAKEFNFPPAQEKAAKARNLIDPQLVLQGFGLTALKVKFYNFDGEEGDPPENTLPTSYLGLPVFSNIELIPGEFLDLKGNNIPYGEILKNNDDKSAFRIDTVLMDITQNKQIIKTNIAGVAGTVKEYISKGDYEITIRGALVDPNGQRYPEEQARQLKEYLEAEEAIEIASSFLNDIFNVQYIVVESFSMPQVEGTQNVQLFEIKAVSDDPIELTVLQNTLSEGARF